MNRSNTWKWLLTIFVVAWSIYELYPPTGRSVIEVFKEQARNRDANFTNIVTRAQELEKELPGRTFANLKEAVGTNEIARYFPQINAKGQKYPSTFVLHRLQQEAAGKIKLGLDLQGGTSFLVSMDTNLLNQSSEKEVALANAVEVLRKRVDKLGVAEPLIQPAGSHQILIQLPGLSQADMDSAISTIEKAAFLEFRMVHEDSLRMLSEDIIPPGYEVLREERKRSDGTKELVPYLVKKGAERGLTGKHIKKAGVVRDPTTNKPEISFEMDSEGARLFAEITREYAPKGSKFHQLAIVLDGELYSAPRIDEPIEGGRGVIRGGDMDTKEAFELANALENPLEAPVQIIQQSTVDPSLGRDSIRSGMIASLIGAVGTFAFMFLFYFFIGFIANFALALNVLILMGLMCSIGTTLTLPGIAGIALTIGMAVDANVLIYERIREELAAGKSLRGSISAGFSKAFGTIFDSNLTTLISSVILIVMGTGPVKGFGWTLTFGLLVNMFTALIVTRLAFDFLLQRNWIKSIRMMPVAKGTKIDFLRWAKLALAVAWIIILAGVGSGFSRGTDILGVEFTGGDSMTMSFAQKLGVDKLRDVIGKLGVGDVMIQYQKDLVSGTETLRVTTRDVGGTVNAAQKVETVLREQFPEAKFQVVGRDKVGATVGKEIQRSAIVASLLASFGILVYVAFRYELSFAVSAVVALFHDVLLTLAVYVLCGREFNAVLVAAVLTIIGYSVNDKIVILDRIREDLKLGVRGSFKELINLALNQTLSRTMITGGSVILATIALLLFGGGAIKDFALAFLTGTIVGTLSSLFIAAPLVLWWNKGQRPKGGIGGSQVAIESATKARAQSPART
jgi:SecD/SecF fusion protein